MSQPSLQIAPTPDLLNGTFTQPPGPLGGAGAAGRNRPAAGAPAEDGKAVNPFAALLSGVLQGAQPAAPASAPATPWGDLTALADEQADAITDPLILLGLPGTATPLPAAPGAPPGDGKPAGNPLPPAGSALPVVPSLPTESAAAPQPLGPETRHVVGSGPPSDATALPTPATATAVDKRALISLADLALNRPLELAEAGSDAAGRLSTGPMAMALAGRSLARRDARASPADSAALLLPPSATTEAATGIPGAVPTVAGAGKISLRLTAADLLRGALVPVASGDGIANQVAVQSAAFAAGNDSGTALASGAPPAGSAVPDSSALLGRLGSTTLAPLQPQADAGTFAIGLADRLLTLGGPGSHSARLKLHPEHLGELDVEISMDDGAAQVWFGTTTSQAREAIEGSLPRLRELFAEQGIQLTRTHIDASGAQMSNAGSGQRHKNAGAYGTEIPAWQAAAISGRGGTVSSRTPTDSASARLLDVWA